MSASAVLADVRSLLTGEPVYLTGSLVAEQAYGKSNAHSDVDLFVPTSNVLMTTGQKMLDGGFKFDDRMDRVWYRWKKMGFNKWHTNSLRLVSPGGVEFNVIYKLADGHPTTSLAQVLESFDFGLLGMGWDLETDTYHDLRGYLFPGMDPDGPLPMMPAKRGNWRQGFLSQYNGLREAGRYAKYYDYGYDLSLVQDDLVTGYRMAELYLSNHFDQDKQLLGRIYGAIAAYLEIDDVAGLSAAYKQLDFKDSLDVIMETLE
jgi:hypothetical protein